MFYEPLFIATFTYWQLHTYCAAGVLNAIFSKTTYLQKKNTNILITNYSEVYKESIEYR